MFGTGPAVPAAQSRMAGVDTTSGGATSKGDDMKRMLVMAGLVAGLSMGGSVVVPAVATADSTCYTGCSPTTGGTDGHGPTVDAHTVTPVTSGALAFTGADIAEMTVVGVGAVGIGGLLVLRSRRRQPA